MPASFVIKRSTPFRRPSSTSNSSVDTQSISHQTFGEYFSYDEDIPSSPSDDTFRRSLVNSEYDKDIKLGLYDILTTENIEIARTTILKLREAGAGKRESRLTSVIEEESSNSANEDSSATPTPPLDIKQEDAKSSQRRKRKHSSTTDEKDEKPPRIRRPKISSLVSDSMSRNTMSSQMIVSATKSFLNKHGSFTFDFSISLTANEKSRFKDQYSQQRAMLLALKRLQPRDVAIKASELYDLMNLKGLLTYKSGDRERFDQNILWEGLLAFVSHDEQEDPRKQGLHRMTLAIQELMRKGFSVGAIRLENFGTKAARFYYVH